MSPLVLKILGTVLVGALGALGHSGITPVPAAAYDTFAGLLIGWLHLPQPGTVKK